jgi:hypothetical protein
LRHERATAISQQYKVSQITYFFLFSTRHGVQKIPKAHVFHDRYPAFPLRIRHDIYHDTLFNFQFLSLFFFFYGFESKRSKWGSGGVLGELMGGRIAFALILFGGRGRLRMWSKREESVQGAQVRCGHRLQLIFFPNFLLAAEALTSPSAQSGLIKR